MQILFKPLYTIAVAIHAKFLFFTTMCYQSYIYIYIYTRISGWPLRVDHVHDHVQGVMVGSASSRRRLTCDSAVFKRFVGSHSEWPSGLILAGFRISGVRVVGSDLVL